MGKARCGLERARAFALAGLSIVAGGWLGCSRDGEQELWSASVVSDYPTLELRLEEVDRGERDSGLRFRAKGREDLRIAGRLCLLDEFTRARGFNRYYFGSEKTQLERWRGLLDRSRFRISFLEPGEEVPLRPDRKKSFSVIEVPEGPSLACSGSVWRSARKAAEERQGPAGSTEVAHETFGVPIRAEWLSRRSGSKVTAEFDRRGQGDTPGAVGVAAEGYRRVVLDRIGSDVLPPRAGTLILEVRMLTAEFTGTTELGLASVDGNEWKILGRENVSLPSTQSSEWEMRAVTVAVPDGQPWESLAAEVYIQGDGQLWVDEMKLYFREPES